MTTTTTNAFTFPQPPPHHPSHYHHHFPHSMQAQQQQQQQQQDPPKPVYNGVDLSYPGLKQVHADPPIFCIDNFLSPQECHYLMQTAEMVQLSPAPVVGKGAGEVTAARTSSTCYLAREDLPDLMGKVTRLTGKPLVHCELPQVGRYLHNQHYHPHFDAFHLDDEDGRRFASNGGQRVVTVLVYLNDVHEGGHTAFPNLGLRVTPRQGRALVFFPATVDGHLDPAVLHAAEPPQTTTKYVSQIWIRQGDYHGQATQRLLPHQRMVLGSNLGAAGGPPPAAAGVPHYASLPSVVAAPPTSTQTPPIPHCASHQQQEQPHLPRQQPPSFFFSSPHAPQPGVFGPNFLQPSAPPQREDQDLTMTDGVRGGAVSW